MVGSETRNARTISSMRRPAERVQGHSTWSRAWIEFVQSANCGVEENTYLRIELTVLAYSPDEPASLN